MDCEGVGEILEQYHEGDTSLKDNREALAHIKECETCRESLLRILYDLDLAAYSAFFEEIEPPAGFTDKVLDALPGGAQKAGRKKTVARRRTPSSSKLAPVKGDRRTASRKGGALKPGRKTGALRRREISKDQQSGLFLQDQIFGSQEKKSGLIITYCEECGERIDPADFESGDAVHFQNASYCKKCKDNVEGLVADKPAARGGRKKAGPARAPTRTAPAARPASGRLVAAPPKKAMNLPLVGGAIMGAAVLLIVAVLVVMNLGGDAGEDYRQRRTRPSDDAAQADSAAGNAEGVDVESSGDAAPSPPGQSAVEAEVEAMARMKKQQEEALKEEERKKGVPYELVKAWGAEVEKILARTPPDFKEAIRFWNERYADAEEGKGVSEDTKTKEKVKFNEEQLSLIQGQRNRVIQRRTRYYEGELERIKNAVHALCNESAPKWEEAKKTAEDVPAGWEVEFQKGVDELKSLRSDIDLWEQNWKRRQIEATKLKAKRDLETGKWVDLFLDQDDLVANWFHRPAEKCIVEKDDDGHTVLRLEGDQTGVYSQHASVPKWFNYELEFEVRGDAGLIILLREPAKDGKRIGVALNPLPAWKKVVAKVDNVVFELYVDGELATSSPASLRSGGLYLIARGAGSVKIRNPKIKINKLN